MSEAKSKMKYNIEYWQKNHPEMTPEEMEDNRSWYARSKSWQNIEYWLNKYPEKSKDECKVLMEDKIKKSLKKRPDNSGVNNPAHKSRTTELERKQRSPKCIEFYELRFPELTDDEREKLRLKHLGYTASKFDPSKSLFCIEYWLAQGLSLKEAKEAREEWQREFGSYTLDNCIKRHGKVKGTKLFNRYLK